MEISTTSAFFANAFGLSYMVTNATFTMYAHNTTSHSSDIMDAYYDIFSISKTEILTKLYIN